MAVIGADPVGVRPRACDEGIARAAAAPHHRRLAARLDAARASGIADVEVSGIRCEVERTVRERDDVALRAFRALRAARALPGDVAQQHVAAVVGAVRLGAGRGKRARCLPDGTREARTACGGRPDATRSRIICSLRELGTALDEPERQVVEIVDVRLHHGMGELMCRDAVEIHRAVFRPAAILASLAVAEIIDILVRIVEGIDIVDKADERRRLARCAVVPVVVAKACLGQRVLRREVAPYIGKPDVDRIRLRSVLRETEPVGLFDQGERGRHDVVDEVVAHLARCLIEA